MKKTLLVLLALMMVLVVAACGTSEEGAQEDGEQTDGATEPTEEITELKMGFVPSRDAEKIADTVTPLSDKLGEILGVPVEAQVMTDYVALVEGMRTGQIDIGFLPPFGYVQAEERANVHVILKAIRNGSDSYRAQYNIRVDAELDDIQSIEDLVDREGLRWAYGDPTSTSGYLFPASQLMDLGIADLDTHFVQTAVGGHDSALIALLNGDADIATTFEDARTVVEGDYPDVMDKVRVLGYTEPIPNDTISIRDGLSEEWQTKIKEAFLSFNDDAAMIEVMNEVYQWTGIAEAQPADYDVVRSTYEKFRDQLSQ